MNLDGFAAVPSATGELAELPIPFGDELVLVRDRSSVVRRAGLPAALGELSERFGRLPWRATRASRRWSWRAAAFRFPRCTRARSRCSASCPRARARRRSSSRRDGRTLGEGDSLEQPGLVADARGTCRRGRRKCLPRLDRRGAARRSTASCSTPTTSRPTGRSGAIRSLVEYRGSTRRHARRALGRSGAAPAAASHLAGLGATERVLRARRRVRRRHRPVASTRRTWSPSTRTAAPACSRTRSASAPASGYPASTLQLNNLLGESDIAPGEPQPGDHSRAAWHRRSSSTRRPRARDRLRRRDALAHRARHGARRDPRRGARRRDGRRRSRASIPRSTLVDAEPGVDEAALGALEESGRTVRRWDRFHHYFGGVSCVGRAGAAGDPRRSGAAHVL